MKSILVSASVICTLIAMAAGALFVSLQWERGRLEKLAACLKIYYNDTGTYASTIVDLGLDSRYLGSVLGVSATPPKDGLFGDYSLSNNSSSSTHATTEMLLLVGSRNYFRGIVGKFYLYSSGRLEGPL